MSIPRRTFIKSAALLGVGGCAVGRAALSAAPENAGTAAASDAVARPPVVVGNNFKTAIVTAGDVLQSGGAALDAIEKGINTVESDPAATTVGFGGMPNWEGVVELDAAIMHGPTQNCGAVAALQDIENPISVARKVMEETDHVFLAGQGARDFALEMGFEEKNLLTEEAAERWRDWRAWQEKEKDYESLQDRITALIEADPKRAAVSLRAFRETTASPRKTARLLFWGLNKEGSARIVEQLPLEERAELTNSLLGLERDWMPLERRIALLRKFEEILTGKAPPAHDTVGLIVLDVNGDLSCGVSTSGAALKLPGRVGDSPIIGAGSFVDNDVGGAIATGMGEHVIRFAGASAIVENMRHGMSPEEACRDVIDRMSSKIQDPNVVFTVLNKDGRYASVGTWGLKSFVSSQGQIAEIERVHIQSEE